MADNDSARTPNDISTANERILIAKTSYRKEFELIERGNLLRAFALCRLGLVAVCL